MDLLLWVCDLGCPCCLGDHRCDGGGVRVIPLHQRPDLLEPTADLVNSEWQRSRGARVHSLQKSCHEFPLVLVMLQGFGNRDCDNEETLLGHVRLSCVVSCPGSLFVESVVVSKDQRGRGYGRTLMKETERYAKFRGFHRLCLTTHDKQHFYAHLGYVLSTPVQNAGIMASFVSMEVLEKFCRFPGTEDTQREVKEGPPPSAQLPFLPPPCLLAPPALSPSLPPPPSCLPHPAAPSVPPLPPPLPHCPANLVVQTLDETPYRDAKGAPIFWMHKDI
ncbi:hypothetical protein UPYG_G00012580 [Umbra pygmaea]|uniref:N-acetyltransferase domain-containing protein n=1 Tax=Umbra pygmaea TaxID=75934 RepID=A0ABD0Y322_UMBPY